MMGFCLLRLKARFRPEQSTEETSASLTRIAEGIADAASCLHQISQGVRTRQVLICGGATWAADVARWAFLPRFAEVQLLLFGCRPALPQGAGQAPCKTRQGPCARTRYAHPTPQSPGKFSDAQQPFPSLCFQH